MELVIYALALGLAAAFIVPLLYGFVASYLPTSITAGVSVPTTYPTSVQAFLISVVLWGIFLGASLWALSYIKPVARAARASY